MSPVPATKPRLASPPVTRTIVDHALSFRLAELPDDVVEWARQCILDYVAVAVAGITEPVSRIILAQATEEGHGPCSVIGDRTRLSPSQAALVNGTVAHALDFDDCNLTMPGHVTAAVMPALFALAEARGKSGAAVVEALVAGFDAGCRAGALIDPGHYDRGFHATATVGSIAAAGGAARLLDLDAKHASWAFGLAATQAAGLKAMFGTMGKPMHAGMAARAGLLGASLAERGFEAREDILECNQGFAATHSPDFDPEAALAAPRSGFHIRDNLFKFHAACYGTHATIDAARAIRLANGIGPSDVRRVVATVSAINDKTCNIRQPTTAAEAKFSLRLMTAYALAGVETGSLASYGVERINDPAMTGLRDKIEIVLDPSLPITQSTVIVETAGGRFEAAHDSGLPPADLADQRRRLEAKFHALVDPVLGAGPAARIVAIIDRLEEAPSLDELSALWSGAAA